MSIAELSLIALGLSMDAFAVSVTNGLYYKNMTKIYALLTALTFGLFQGIMPALGYALGYTFTDYITRYDHFIALLLLSFIGAKMIHEAIKESKSDSDKDCSSSQKISIGILLIQGIATSIDALIVGVSFAAMNVSILKSSIFIASITFVCCLIGVAVGKKFGSVFNKKAQIIGGLILIGIGIKICIEHLTE